jgi:hypothetical protein
MDEWDDTARWGTDRHIQTTADAQTSLTLKKQATEVPSQGVEGPEGETDHSLLSKLCVYLYLHSLIRLPWRDAQRRRSTLQA